MKIQLKSIVILLTLITLYSFLNAQTKVHPDLRYAEGELINKKANGFNGIWYMNQPSNDEYVYKYSGGLAVYCAKHQPFGVYSEKADKTFFCFGGTDDSNSTLFHNVSYFDHKTGKVANPTVILDKKTTDAHDNPVISMDDKGYIWVFSTSHGTSRPSYISRSSKPYNIKKFEKIDATEIENGVEKPFDNFSYFQIWHVKNKGFMALFTKYRNGHRVTGFNTSKDGIRWNEWKVIGHIEMGHYQISGENNGKISVAFNYHPEPKGLNWRTNLYYLETTDFGESWQTASGQKVQLPLTTPDNPALVKNFQEEGLNCYMKDLNFDKEGNPVVMVISSKGYESGPQNNPRKWELFHYKNNEWKNHVVTTSDNNYDMGSLYIESEETWRIIGPTEQGPQPYNPGGEVAVWVSKDSGNLWQKEKQLTSHSEKNHSYVRRPVNVHPGFYGIWADGHGRQPSKSSLYICDKAGNVFRLPEEISEPFIKPEAVASANNSGLEYWPEGKSPKEIGKKVTERYLVSPYKIRTKAPVGVITYPEVCTWYGALSFAREIDDKDLTKRLVERFDPMLKEKKNMIPVPDHVDYTVFGAVPLELYRQTKKQKYLEIGKSMADAQWGLPHGPRVTEESHKYYEQGLTWQTRMWIDDMYMITLVQSQAYRATGDGKYIERAAKEMVIYLDELQRKSGLFFHAPDVPFFWGRGNGWMAAGMSELLLSLPSDNSNRLRIMEGYKTMMASLLKYQGEDGMWRQLIDDPESWQETSCTGMFTFAMITGVKEGWLDSKVYGAAARKGWLGLISYLDENSDIREVCQGTNKKNDRQYYLDRERRTGDLHGQAPMLWCATALSR